MLNYRLMTIGDYEAAYDLWIKCGNGLNNKDDSYEELFAPSQTILMRLWLPRVEK